MTMHLDQSAAPSRGRTRTGPARRPHSPKGITESTRLPFPATLFLISAIIPLVLQIGPFRLSPNRLVLAVMLLPCLFMLISGRAGPIRKADICVILICFWSSLSLFVIHGTSMTEAAGMLTIEVLGAYLMGRCFIRTPEHFHAMARTVFSLVMVLLPFAVFENVTGTDLYLRLFGLVGPVGSEVNIPPRLGLDRAQGPFAHPILLGVFCGSSLGITYYVLGYGRTMRQRLRNSLLVIWTTFTALSSGPLSSIVSQVIIMGWNTVFSSIRNKWRMLAAWCAICYIILDLLSNRKPFVVLIDYLALSASTGFNRLRIWEWGTKNIYDNPLFGIGFNDWERLEWMVDSVDMFWVLGGMRHGMLVWILWFALFFLLTVSIGRLRNLDSRVHSYRMGYMVTMVGFFICGWMVTFWNEVLTMFLFMLASGAWMLDYRPPVLTEDRSGAAPGTMQRTVL